MTGPNVELEPKDLRAVLAAAKAFDPKLATALRKRLKTVGDNAAGAVRATLRQPTPGGHAGGGIRGTLAAATKVSILAGKSSAGIRITTSGAGLGAAHAAMLRAYNQTSWRHPVFGTRSFVSQNGRPFFGVVIDRHRHDATAAAEVALADAIAQMTTT